jgi:adenylylsulfate kinase
VCHLLSRNNVVAIGAAISPYRAIRDESRAMIGDFVEVFADTPIEVCERRDAKGLYARARAGELKGFTGVDDPYEAPLAPEVVCRTAEETVDECVGNVLAKLEALGYLVPCMVCGYGGGL